jgi:hypothetical protein
MLPNRPDQAHVLYVLSRERLSPAEREAWTGAERGRLDALRFDDINVETDACRRGPTIASGGGAA